MKQKRAPKGGIVGTNGEFYEGGKFLPSTGLPKRPGTGHRRTGKCEIEPYRWEIYQGQLGENEFADGFYKLIPGTPVWATGERSTQRSIKSWTFSLTSDQARTMLNYGSSIEEIKRSFNKLSEAWDNGFRWRVAIYGTGDIVRFERPWPR